MRIGLDFGIFKINVGKTGAIRVGAKLGDTYISHKIVKPATKKKSVIPKKVTKT